MLMRIGLDLTKNVFPVKGIRQLLTLSDHWQRKPSAKSCRIGCQSREIRRQECLASGSLAALMAAEARFTHNIASL